MNRNVSFFINGFLFSMFWASASVAGKFGLFSVEPLVLFTTRFLIAGTLLLAFDYFFQTEKIPHGKEWLHLTIFALLNTTLYLGIFVFALQQVSPGITTLAVAVNPLLISIFSALWMNRRISVIEWLAIFLGMTGVFVAAYPLLKHSHATTFGMILLLMSMIAYSVGAVYYASIKWTLSRTAINGWQALIGGIILIPFAIFFHKTDNHFDVRFWLSVLWLVLPVSVLAIQLWLWLVRHDTVRASLWLYLCPAFGFTYAALLLDEPITLYTFCGTAMVIGALYLGQKMVAK